MDKSYKQISNIQRFSKWTQAGKSWVKAEIWEKGLMPDELTISVLSAWSHAEVSVTQGDYISNRKVTFLWKKRSKRQKWGQPQLQENEKEIPERSDPKREGPQFFRYTLPKYLNNPWITHAYGSLQASQQKNRTTLNWRLSHHKRDSICSLSH